VPKLKNVEKKIWDIESFAVTIKYFDGRDVRGDLKDFPQYPAFEKMAKNDWTVAEWREKRFAVYYPGYDVDVLDGYGQTVGGNMKLATVRDSYYDE